MRKAFLGLLVLAAFWGNPGLAAEREIAPVQLVFPEFAPAGAAISPLDAALAPGPAAAALPEASLGVAPLQLPRLPDLSAFRTVVVDVRGARGGNGDVAAGYLTVTDMLARSPAAARSPTYRFIVDGDAEKILSKMLGRKVEAGGSAYEGRVEFHTSETLPADAPADLYLTLANPTGALQNPEDLRRGPRGAAAKPEGFIRIDDKTVLVAQTVLGNTEDWRGENPHALIQVGDHALKMTPAGFKPGEQGVYGDTVARLLRGRPRDEVRRYLHERLYSVPEPRDRLLIGAILDQKAFAGAEVGLVYAIHSPEQKKQFADYVHALAVDAAETGKSYALLSPLNLALKDLPEDLHRQVQIVDGDTVKVPKRAKAGKIYFIRTRALPHPVFVGLMAYSQIPPVIAGDGGLSAAVALGRPFVSTRVAWNAKNLNNILELFYDSAPDEDAQHLFYDVFGLMKLDRALEVASQTQAFARLASQIPTLTDNLVAAIRAARALNWEHEPAEAIISGVKDETLRRDLLRVRAERRGLDAPAPPRPRFSLLGRLAAWLKTEWNYLLEALLGLRPPKPPKR